MAEQCTGFALRGADGGDDRDGLAGHGGDVHLDSVRWPPEHHEHEDEGENLRTVHDGLARRHLEPLCRLGVHIAEAARHRTEPAANASILIEVGDELLVRFPADARRHRMVLSGSMFVPRRV